MNFLLTSNFLALGLRLFTEAKDGGSRGKVLLILNKVFCGWVIEFSLIFLILPVLG
jgi:hypothetical protein